MRTPMEQFTTLLETVALIVSLNAIDNRQMEEDFNAFWKGVYRRKYPRRRKPPHYQDVADEFQEVRELFGQLKPIATQRMHDQMLMKDQAEEELQRLARELEVELSDEPVLAGSHNGYRTQCNPLFYARGAAELEADHYREIGLKVEVREVRPTRTDDLRYAEVLTHFDVYVYTTELGLEIARRKPGLSLRQWLKNCWKRSINPRVLNPFLPAGLEERLGVGYQGQDIKKEELCQASA